MSSPTLRSDRLRVALDAYSEVLSEREQSGRTFTNGDHAKAMQAALDAADAVLATQQPETSVEDSIVVSADEVAEMVRTLNAERVQALRIMAEMTPKFGAGVVPLGRFVHGATASALYRRGLIAMRSRPLVGYVFTALGRAVLNALTEPTPEPERSQGTLVGDTPQGALTVSPLGSALPGMTLSQIREAQVSARLITKAQSVILLYLFDRRDHLFTGPVTKGQQRSAEAMVRRGFLQRHPDGFRLTDRGFIAAKYRREQQS